MLLQRLAEYARSRGLVDDPAFSDRAIRWIIPLDLSGSILGAGPEDTTGENKRAKAYSAPRTALYKAVGGVAEFLADGLTALLGLEADPAKPIPDAKRPAREANNRAKQLDFWCQIERAHEATAHPGLAAALAFRDRHRSSLPGFLRLDSESGKPKWVLTTAGGAEVTYKGESFTFRVIGVAGESLLIEDEEVIRPWWRVMYGQQVERTVENAEEGLCLVSGRQGVPIARTHDVKISGGRNGVPGASTMGAAIVSFDKPAFASYGFKQSLNAPVSIDAASAYPRGFNGLLADPQTRVRLGPAVLCFWAAERRADEGLFARLLDRPDPQTVADLVRSHWAGVDRSHPRVDPFYSVVVTGNAGRVVVRDWAQSTVDAAKAHLAGWFADLSLFGTGTGEAEQWWRGDAARAARGKRTSGPAQTPPGAPDSTAGPQGAAGPPPPLALRRLACSMGQNTDDVSVEVLVALSRAALQGLPPPLSLLTRLLQRLHVDLSHDGRDGLRYYRYHPAQKRLAVGPSRFALARLILNRNRKEDEPEMQPKVFDTDDPAYNCGRLLAILDDLQQAAHEYRLEGAGVVERYYGTASSAPNSAFPILWRLHQHHLRKVERLGKGGTAAAIKRRIAEVASHFTPSAPGGSPHFPRTFSLVEQGRFALGFYQEMAASFERMAAWHADQQSADRGIGAGVDPEVQP